MSRLRFLTAGESHGPQVTAILDGCPAGLAVTREAVDRDLARRQGGFGRGARQQIEADAVTLVGGVRYGRTTGAPLGMVVANRDSGNWGASLAVDASAEVATPVRIPRPGHADLMGHLEYGLDDLRDVIERASARETAARVACGSIARLLLAEVGCRVVSHVTAIGGVVSKGAASLEACRRADDDPVRCIDPDASKAMRDAIVDAGQAGDTLGGVFEVIAFGFPPGVGSYVQGDLRLGARLAAAAMSVPAMKGVEIGDGFALAGDPGSRVHDEIVVVDGDYRRRSNRAGGIEGGISTGEPVVVRVAMKPIATLLEPLQSIDLDSGEVTESRFERSDVCAVPAAAVVGEAVVALALADAALDRFGGATVAEFASAVAAFRERIVRR
jgi:chorismate synthase